MVGAGDGGFFLVFVPPSKDLNVRDNLNSLSQVPFKLEFVGSQIIFCDREEDYAAEETARPAEPIRAFRELMP